MRMYNPIRSITRAMLETERLILRRWKPSDRDPFARMGFHEKKSLLYLEARCLCLQRAMFEPMDWMRFNRYCFPVRLMVATRISDAVPMIIPNDVSANLTLLLQKVS